MNERPLIKFDNTKDKDSRFLIIVTIVATLGGLLFGFGKSVISGVIPLIWIDRCCCFMGSKLRRYSYLPCYLKPASQRRRLQMLKNSC
jgi:hypothetical protein